MATKIVESKPPSSLMRSYAIPEYTGKTWGDHYPYEDELIAVIKRHEADKAALRQFYK